MRIERHPAAICTQSRTCREIDRRTNREETTDSWLTTLKPSRVRRLVKPLFSRRARFSVGQRRSVIRACSGSTNSPNLGAYWGSTVSYGSGRAIREYVTAKCCARCSRYGAIIVADRKPLATRSASKARGSVDHALADSKSGRRAGPSITISGVMRVASLRGRSNGADVSVTGSGGSGSRRAMDEMHNILAGRFSPLVKSCLDVLWEINYVSHGPSLTRFVTHSQQIEGGNGPSPSYLHGHLPNAR